MEEETRQVLSREEQQKADAFVKSEERERYLRSHLYLRKILSTYMPQISPSEWVFRHNRYGKPAIANRTDKSLYFNLSHTASCAYVIISEHALCGIDVEVQKTMEITQGICELVLSKEELYYYSILDNKESVFYTLWTLKEAHLKALGSGLMEISPTELDLLSHLDLSQEREHFRIGRTAYWRQRVGERTFLAFCVMGVQRALTPRYRDHAELH